MYISIIIEELILYIIVVMNLMKNVTNLSNHALDYFRQLNK